MARALGAIEYSTVTKFPEQVWCKTPKNDGASLFVGMCYRTPTESVFGSDLHQLARDVLNEMSGKHISITTMVILIWVKISQ